MRHYDLELSFPELLPALIIPLCWPLRAKWRWSSLAIPWWPPMLKPQLRLLSHLGCACGLQGSGHASPVLVFINSSLTCFLSCCLNVYLKTRTLDQMSLFLGLLLAQWGNRVKPGSWAMHLWGRGCTCRALRVGHSCSVQLTQMTQEH